MYGQDQAAEQIASFITNTAYIINTQQALSEMKSPLLYSTKY